MSLKHHSSHTIFAWTLSPVCAVESASVSVLHIFNFP